MAKLQTRYAKAMFELSIERGLTDAYKEQATFISIAMSDPETNRIITHPRISIKEKLAFLDAVFTNRVHDDFLGFMRLLVTKNREEFLVLAMDNLVKLILQHQNFTTAKVVSAYSLSNEQLSGLQASLMRKLGKRVDVETEVDIELIGGFRIHVDGYIFDRTIKHLLKDMKENIGKETVR